VLLSLIADLSVIVGSFIALVVILPTVGWYLASCRRCPRCYRHALSWIDNGVFYDPHPGRSLHRCRRCGAEFVRVRWRWVTREEWDRQQGGDIWDELNGSEY
jgi:hypothetical protein